MAARAKERIIYDVKHPSENCLIVGVSDGDTLKVRCGEAGDYRQNNVRISAIDAPEKKQAYGQRIKDSLSVLCLDDQAVITSDKRDKYGRTVAAVSCRGRDVALHQVNAGMAWFYVKYSRDAVIRDAEWQARATKTGLWADVEPVVAPWAFRHPRR